MSTASSIPAVVTVGDELILGERRNGNQEWLLSFFAGRGHQAGAALILPDDIEVIGRGIATLRDFGHWPIVVSGGLGGTHDDLTRQGIARALDVPIERHAECFAILNDRYGEKFTAQRQRMTDLPRGCRLLPNPLGAPGFELDGVYAFPGFPNMLQPMIEALATELAPSAGPPRSAVEVTLATVEGEIAMEIERFCKDHPAVAVGIYPSATRFPGSVTLRLRHTEDDAAAVAGFRALVSGIAARLGIEPQWL